MWVIRGGIRVRTLSTDLDFLGLTASPLWDHPGLIGPKSIVLVSGLTCSYPPRCRYRAKMSPRDGELHPAGVVLPVLEYHGGRDEWRCPWVSSLAPCSLWDAPPPPTCCSLSRGPSPEPMIPLCQSSRPQRVPRRRSCHKGSSQPHRFR